MTARLRIGRMLRSSLRSVAGVTSTWRQPASGPPPRNPTAVIAAITNGAFHLRYRVLARRLPTVITLTDFDACGVRFEALTATELYRILGRGDEVEYLNRMLSMLRPEDVLYDIGANIGLVALHAASRCRTVAFEPDPGFLHRLRRNVALNPSAAVDVRPVAISNSTQAVHLFTSGAGGNSPSLVNQRNEQNVVEVQATTLDTLSRDNTLPAPTVLKLDIEGAEILALRGADSLLNGPAAPRLLFLELHDTFLPAFGSTADEVLALTGSAGYDIVHYREKRHDQQHLILGRR